MNDLEFIKTFDKKLSTHYEKSKSYCLDTPTHSLIILRSFVVDFTELLASYYKIDLQKTYLYKKIEQLAVVKKIDKEIISILHEIRVDSNQGAHFEKSNLSFDEFSTLAIANIKKACKMVELFYSIKNNKPSPKYKFEDLKSSITKDMCYKAIMEDDLDSQYIIGLNLQAKAKLEHLKEYNQLKSEGHQYLINPKSFKLLEKATYWFKQSSLTLEHPNAIFEFAMCLLYGEGVKQDEEEGERLIEIAAKKESTNAKAILGAFYINGSLLFKQDHKKALEYLEIAAKEEHPEALTNLSYMYKDSIGVKEDLNLSYKYMKKASYAGYSHAQYHLSNFYFNGIGIKKDQKKAMNLLDKALNKDYPPAIITKARLLLQGEHIDQDLELSEKLYVNYIELENNFEVLLELIENYINGLFGNKTQDQILLLLEKCINHSNNKDIANRAKELMSNIK